MQIQINNVTGYTSGDIIDIKTDESGVPLDKFWRDRLKDAKIDQCIEAVKASKKPKVEESKS